MTMKSLHVAILKRAESRRDIMERNRKAEADRDFRAAAIERRRLPEPEVAPPVELPPTRYGYRGRLVVWH